MPLYQMWHLLSNEEIGYCRSYPGFMRFGLCDEWGGASIFKREYTLASGGPYCDCGYIKK